jgi:hypothetical protein
MRGTIENVDVSVGFSNSYALSCDYEGCHYHVWVYRNGRELQSQQLYKNPIDPEGKLRPGDEGHFNTRQLRATSRFGSWLVAQMRAIADRDGLWQRAEEQELVKVAAEAKERAERIVLHLKKEAGAELYAACMAALASLRAVQAEDDPHGMPYVEIQQLEDAIRLADEGKQDDTSRA